MFTCKNFNIHNNIFKNFVGRTVTATGLSENIVTSNNQLIWDTFHSSSRGIIYDWSKQLAGYDSSKAPFNSKIDGNVFYNCNMCIFAGGSTHDIIISDNIGKNFGMAIGLYRGDEDITHSRKTYNHNVYGNIFDYQLPYGGGTEFNPFILIQDVQNTNFNNNTFTNICYGKISEMKNLKINNCIFKFRDKTGGETATKLGLQLSTNNLVEFNNCSIFTKVIIVVSIKDDANDIQTFDNNYYIFNSCSLENEVNEIFISINQSNSKVDILNSYFSSSNATNVYNFIRIISSKMVTAISNRYKGTNNLLDQDFDMSKKNAINNFKIA